MSRLGFGLGFGLNNITTLGGATEIFSANVANYAGTQTTDYLSLGNPSALDITDTVSLSTFVDLQGVPASNHAHLIGSKNSGAEQQGYALFYNKGNGRYRFQIYNTSN